MAQLNVTELDFDQIKSNLKTFLKSQTEFSDYNFEGSSFAVLIDLLAYNTHYNGVLASMLANESFLDSAVKRESVASLAKAIGYTPRSNRSPTGKVNLTITPTSGYTSTNLTLPRSTTFTSTFEGVTYQFYPKEDVTVSKSVVDNVGVFVFNDLELKEGIRVTNQFTVETANPQGPYVIPNKRIDTTTIRVRVQTSLSDTTLTTWNVSDKFLDIKNDTKTWWLEEGADGLYQLRFGDGVIGQKLTVDNVVIVDYIATKGDDANGCKTWSISSTVTGSGETASLTTVADASSGAAKESIDSIRFNAPRVNATRDRAVTSKDYQSLILASNPNIQSVAVWGGEKNDPPIYGKVFISLNPVSGYTITTQDQDNILNSIINPKTPVAIQPEFVDPEFVYIGLKIKAAYDPKVTTLSQGQIKSAISSSVNEYFEQNLNKLNKSFYISRIHDLIVSDSESIISVNIEPYLQKRIDLTLNSPFAYEAKFNTKVQPRELKSSYFDVELSGNTHKVYLSDTPASTVVAPNYTGTGTVNFVDTDGTTIIGAAGTIDYDSGTVSLNSMTVKSLYGTDKKLKVRIKPHDSYKDITTDALIRTSDTSTAAVVAKPSRNTVLTLDDSAASSTTNTDVGVDITVTPEVEEI